MKLRIIKGKIYCKGLIKKLAREEAEDNDKIIYDQILKDLKITKINLMGA